MGSLTEIGVPIERRTPDPAYTGPEYYVVGELRGDERPPPDIDRRGFMHPTRLWSVMTGPSPHTEQTSIAIPDDGATTIAVTELTEYPRSVKPYRHSDLHTLAKVALWAVPVSMIGGAALGYWMGKRTR